MCLAHTHTHTINTGLVQIWFPTKHWEIELFSERNTRTYGVFSLFKSVTHTHFGYRLVRIWLLTEVAREIESWGPGFTRQGRRESAGFHGGLREGGPRVLVLYQESGTAVFQEFAAQFQGIPNGVLLGTNSPERGRGGPGGLELHQTLS